MNKVQSVSLADATSGPPRKAGIGDTSGQDIRIAPPPRRRRLLIAAGSNYGVGKTIYINDTEPLTIRGVVERLQGPWSGWDEGVEYTTLVPQHLLGNSTSYLVRTEPGRRDALMP